MSDLRQRLSAGAYQAYAYAYPHKTAYRDLPAPVDLAPLWQAEDRDHLFAYLHVPFCTYRCGFCNLFALGRPADDLVEAYTAQLERQIAVVGQALGTHRVVRFAIGGGTPSYLAASQLDRLFAAVGRHLKADLGAIPGGIEVSPETATHDRLALCRARGIDRVSMGVQSFVDTELDALVRPAQREAVTQAIECVRALGFPTLNLDLIYGIPGQSAQSLRQSIATALAFAPEELYLYPLYVRAKTGLGRIAEKRGGAADTRDALYAVARDALLDAGYAQVSMRMFRAPHAPATDGPAYCCQDDGMIGMGCGARSYTRTLHYSDHYGVARASVAQILRNYVEAPVAHFAQARYGFRLDAEEQRRRYVIQSLLTWPGLDETAYARRFGTAAMTDLPQLADLFALGLASRNGDTIALTADGMARADTIGPWLVSPAVQSRMDAYAAA
jgi:oxygen-independent coproporphyrinogen-3 oxidase